MKDNCKNNVVGKVLAEKLVGNQWVEVFHENNLVVANAGSILRDLVFGDSGNITKMEFGTGTNEAQSTDTQLQTKFFEKSVTKTKVDSGARPGIQYVVILSESEGNGGSSSNITEYGLATDSKGIFSRKVRSPILKDSNTSLRFTWTLVFN
jgi:hypothetical protein